METYEDYKTAKLCEYAYLIGQLRAMVMPCAQDDKTMREMYDEIAKGAIAKYEALTSSAAKVQA
jgi:hypothetical protein